MKKGFLNFKLFTLLSMGKTFLHNKTNISKLLKLSRGLLILKFGIFNFFFNSRISCFSVKKEEISNVFYPANDPIEDRFEIKFLENIDNALLVSVLDGHGGHTLSDFTNQRMSEYIQKFYIELKSEANISDEKNLIATSIKKAFNQIEEEFKEKALDYYNRGYGKMATVGSCVLVCLIHNDTLYVANLGDSKARIIRNENGKYSSLKLMHRHNSEKPREKEILYKNFPNDDDIVVCKRKDGTVCYVKGRLQPTRSLGDFHLKYKEFNEFSNDGYKRPVKNFNGPYISADPEITVYPLNYNIDKYLIVATDGLGDFVNSKEVVKYVESNEYNNKKPDANDLLDIVLSKAAQESRLSIEQLKNKPLGYRRNLHDDTTIIIVPLKQ